MLFNFLTSQLLQRTKKNATSFSLKLLILNGLLVDLMRKAKLMKRWPQNKFALLYLSSKICRFLSVLGRPVLYLHSLYLLLKYLFVLSMVQTHFVTVDFIILCRHQCVTVQPYFCCSLELSSEASQHSQPRPRMQSAAQAVGEVLQSPDDLLKIAAFRNKLEKEKASIDAKLKSGVREQLAATADGLRKLLSTRNNVQGIKDEMSNIDGKCRDPRNEVATFDQISRVGKQLNYDARN